MQRLLVIDDDPKLGGLLREYLGARGYQVELAGDGPRGLERHAQGDVDLVILDVMMPGMDGLEVLRQLRAAARTPVVMLTARGDDVDRIIGLELGADDYLPKPFNPRELLARISAVLRRGAPAPAQVQPLSANGIRLDPERREVEVDGQPVDLTTTEFELLRALLAAAGRIIPRERLMELARGQEWAAFDRSVDVHISHLRRKLGDDPKAPRRIKTIRGVGYLVPRA
ncbi:MAG: response regulator transcription factor [Deltaproteobacteria bacterium]|jgi:DNA-binding response OmpR family regulator|nr:response regulator transcription factor [Deltaproteobacteria bacterium]